MPKEAELRSLSRRYGVTVAEVQEIFHVFTRTDTDGSGTVECEEFVAVLQDLLKVPRDQVIEEKKVRKFWGELDEKKTGSVGFEGFLRYHHRATSSPMRRQRRRQAW